MENLAVDALSPSVILVLAQFAAKLAGKLLAPSDTLAIAGFVRRLVFKLAGEQRLDISAYHLWEKANAMMPKNLYSQYACVTAAIRREVSIMHKCLSRLTEVRGHAEPSTSSEVADLRKSMEYLCV
ncbi:hypothetical protein EDD22DRAFT_911418 [Suillus occidentalis]|nr:hypothetical protein EDD22DRAFT_911418 [Suillus occidentalis]